MHIYICEMYTGFSKRGGGRPKILKFPPGFSKSPKVGGEHSPLDFYCGCLENVPKLIENVHFVAG